MNENSTTSASSPINAPVLITIFWLISLVFTGFLSYSYGRESVQSQSKAEEKVLNAQTSQLNPMPTPTTVSENVTTVPEFTVPANNNEVSSTNPAVNNTTSCAKTGLAQKWEYLKPYTVKTNDTLQSIAKDELHDDSRVNELLKINGVGPYVVGSTLYLPPDNITKSSGNIQLVHGKLVDKNDTSWHVSFTSDKSGQGILIPSFLFASVTNKDSFTVGDCISILFDNGYKIYSLSTQ